MDPSPLTILTTPRRNTRALLGVVIWLGLVAVSAAGRLGLGTIELLFTLAPLVIVPLGLVLTAQLDSERPGRVESLATTLQPFTALLAIVSFWFPPGRPAASLAAGWFVFSAVLGVSGLWRMFRGGLASLDTACGAVAKIYLLVGGAWLVASRAGLRPMGFQEPIVLLTAVHFHYAGFAAPLLAQATGRALRASSRGLRAVFRLSATGVVAGPALLAVGFVLGRHMKLGAALILVLSQIGLAVCILGVLPTTARLGRKVLLAISAGSVVFAMALSAVWAVGEYLLHGFIHLDAMARIHGTANALGFTLCGLLGWQMEAQPQRGRP